MPITKEFTIQMEDRPGVLVKICQALADKQVNLLAFQSFPVSGKSSVRIITDSPVVTARVLEEARAHFTETEVVQVKLEHRPGGLARAATQLGEASININYVYSGLDAHSAPLVVFGVKDPGKAATILDRMAAAA